MAKRLLVTDDAIIIREIIKDTARKAGWEIVGEASNGQSAIEKYHELKPDAMTLDLVMPQYDGLHALKGILSDDPNAKIVVVSALDQKNILKDAFKLGASDFIVKPFDHSKLMETLERLVA
ncbi:response regulator receiver protein [Pirellula staleyi DSM 6068]|uniref:Response regulator receiver protein n=1 Tax=Pirellula staleyi (strain ATCC 27377 / DSM 6068 / ICPB 4128) TaxID=530564 RepID=D2QXD4_PIRSD|nr:response regulator [Pirellula staleyi]ADB17974.1 response regulator receiver protein [Pirellula staleyi DSM 6068]